MSEEKLLGVELVGELGDLSSVVESGTISMAFATGRTNDETAVLVPLMTCQLIGEFGRSHEKASPSVTLPYDNVAFLLMQFGTEYLDVLDMFDAVAPGRLGAPLDRLELSADWLENGSAALMRAAKRLREIAKQMEPSIDAIEGTKPHATKTVEPAPEKKKILIRRTITRRPSKSQ